MPSVSDTLYMTSTSPSLAAANELLAAHPLVDGHNDLAWRMRTRANYDLDAVDLAAGYEIAHTDIPRVRAGRLGAQFWSVYVPSSLSGDAAVSSTSSRSTSYIGSSSDIRTSSDWRSPPTTPFVSSNRVASHPSSAPRGITRSTVPWAR